jgi:hypothetical protein
MFARLELSNSEDETSLASRMLVERCLACEADRSGKSYEPSLKDDDDDEEDIRTRRLQS